MPTMAPTPRPAGWKGGGEDFGFLRTFDGHQAPDIVGARPNDEHARFGYSNVKWGFDEADIGGDYDPTYDIHCDDISGDA